MQTASPLPLCSQAERAARVAQLVAALIVAFKRPAPLRDRLRWAKLLYQARQLQRRIAEGDGPDDDSPPPTPPPAGAAARPHADDPRPDGLHINWQYGQWDVVRGGRRIAASRPRLDAEAIYDRAA